MNQIGHLNIPKESPKVITKQTTRKPITIPSEPGHITKSLGTGDDAKNSLIYLTIKWAFWGGIIVSVLLIINCWIFRVNEKVPDLTVDLLRWWQVLIPLITLALGYAFGKSDTRK